MKGNHHVLPPNQHFSLLAKMKEDTGKSMKNALYVMRYAKRYLSGRSNVKQNQAFGISQSVENFV